MERTSLGKIISGLYRHIAVLINREAGDLPISSGQISFYTEIAGTPGLSQDELSRRLWVDKATTARAVKKLVDCGLVRREHDSEDKRIFRLFLSPAGEKAFVPIKKVLLTVTDTLSKGFSHEEMESLSRYLTRLMNNIEMENEGGNR